MLTGGPPFQCEDPAELVHAHLAWTPVPPLARNPSVPEVLSNIVVRLLAKMPEQRYQSADALLADLTEARRQWQASEAIAPFELGRLDLGQALGTPAGLHGRDLELAALEEAFERTRAGRCELVLLSGPPGIGKSRLAEALRDRAEGRGRIVAGQADPLHGNLPYGLLAGPLRAFVRGLLREPARVVGRWRARLVDSLGANAGLVADVIPELRVLIGDTPLPAAVGALATEHRFRLTLQALVQALAENDAPLVLVLDDLQWADAPSLALLESLVSAPDAHHLMVVATSRPDEEGGPGRVGKLLESARSAGAGVQTLALGPLDLNMLTGLCAELLRTPVQRTGTLAQLLLRKTAGNPFFAERFLRLLQRTGLLAFDEREGDWRWDLAGAEALAVTDNVVDLMVGAVMKLSPETTELLTIAACMRAQVDLELLAAVVGQPVGETARRLWSALRDGLLVPARGERPELPAGDVADTGGASYRFAHDRVRQAAYSLLPVREQQRIHLAIGRRLQEGFGSPPADAELFDAVDQVHRGAAQISDPAERLRLAELALRAAQRARAAGALGPSLEYARHGIDVLPPGTRGSARALWLALHRLAAECAFCTGDGAAGETFFAEALEHASTPVEKAELHGVRVNGEAVRMAQRAAITWGREGLRLLDLPLPDDLTPEVIARELAVVREKLGGRPISALADLPRMEDPAALTALDLMRRTALAAQIVDAELWSMTLIRMVALSIERGNGPASAYGYVGFGLVMLEVGTDDAGAEAFGRVGVELARKPGDPGIEASVLTAFAVLSNHWQAPMRTNVPILQRAVQAALEGGELQMACWAAAALVSNLFHAGVELARVDAECAAGMRLVQKTGQRPLMGFLRPYRAAIRQLQAPRRDRTPTLEEPGWAASITGQGGGFKDHPMALVAPCLLRDLAEVERLFREKRQLYQFVAGLKRTVATPWFTFHTALAAAQLFDAGTVEDRAVLRAGLAENQRALAGWAERCPENFGHRADLIGAERARLEGKLSEALPLYDRAIEGARRQQFLHDEAIAYELAGRCRLAAGLHQTAASYLQDARAVFARWGAAAKVEALDEEFPDVASGAGAGAVLAASSSDETGAAALDLQSLRKATETLSSEVVLDRLLEKLIAVCLEIAGARHGALVLQQGAQLEVRAQGAVSEPVALEQVALGASPRVPRTLVEHVFASGEPLVLGDAARQGSFTADPYIASRGVRSALALPIRQHGRPVGVLYLENDLATHGFPPERVRVLDMLSSQIAISLENSQLFEDLKIEVADRTRAEQAVRFLAEASAAMAESLDYRTTLAEVARLAVPFLADWCTVDVAEGEDRLVPVAAVHVDPARQASLDELRRAFPVVPPSYQVSAEAVRTRQAKLIQQVSEERMAQAIADPRLLALTQAIGARSVLAVPLLARGRALGAITLAFAGSGRRYEAADVALAQELARRAAIAIDNAWLYQQAQEAIRLRDDFLTVASHELNTPIASLRLSVAPFIDGMPRPPPETVNRLLAIVDRQSERLATLVGEILEVSRAQGGAFRPRLAPVDLTALIKDTAARLEEMLAQGRCPLSLELEPAVTGRWDASALERVFTNLLSNATKFGSGKPIAVKLWADAGTARLSVSDQGIGIEAGQLARIFERFARAVPAEHYGGLGLGLYIAREIVSALGGTIGVDSTPGAGAIFIIELPLAGP